MARRVARAVRVGDVVIGAGAAPVIQSMTSTPTHATDATWAHVRRLHAGGARLVRVAVPDRRALLSLGALQEARRASGLTVPLVGDVHFSSALALGALEWVEKVRINPGNLLEAPRGRSGGRSPARARDEALRMIYREASVRKRALRIGVNQGSLSRRVVREFGTGAEAMVESAMEYLRTADETGFSDVVVSLKSSDPWEVVASNLRLAALCDAPLHVGVTEAGFGLQGRARSAVGVGLLVRRGLADTIRVSLAEPPEAELPVAAAFVAAARPLTTPGARVGAWRVTGAQIRSTASRTGPFTRTRIIGPNESVADSAGVLPVRALRPGEDVPAFQVPTLIRLDAACASPGELAAALSSWAERGLPPQVREVLLPLPGSGPGGEDALTEVLARIPVPLTWIAAPRDEGELARIMVDVAQLVEAGAIQWLELATGGTPEEDRDAALDILQGLGTGQWRASLIACPQCGRCRIDVTALAEEVRRRLGARRGLTIGVMGCIVNGPGEMEGADIGCVGEGVGKVALYARGRMIERGVPVEEAAERLANLADRCVDTRDDTPGGA